MGDSGDRMERTKVKLQRCMEWLQVRNNPHLHVEDDDQSITDSECMKLETEDLTTVPAAVDESAVKPKAVPLRRLRQEGLRMECEWQSCKYYFTDYAMFQKHVENHVSDVHVIESKGKVQHVCLWDICGHCTVDLSEMVRHINYHAYHAKLLAIGFNGRATLQLKKCEKDSTRRNILPPLKNAHCCMWVGCSESFKSIQVFFDHVKSHINLSQNYLCSWAGCGATFPRRVLLTMHVRSHTGEKLIACFHCGHHFVCNGKLSDHLLRQNVQESSGYACSMCGIPCATAYLKREHERQHVSAYACALCDMSAPSPATLAHHVRYRHLGADTRMHACPHCPYRAVTRWDLKKHIPTHKKRKRDESTSDVEDLSDEDLEIIEKKKGKKNKMYACHMCPEKEVKVFSRGTRLTTHLVKVHGAQWPRGHSRFRYQISEDGMYRLTTTRLEFEDVSKKIVDGYSWPKESLTNKFEFELKQISEATTTSPRSYEVTLKNNKVERKPEVGGEVEIMLCNVDEDGTIISTETITDVIFK